MPTPRITATAAAITLAITACGDSTKRTETTHTRMSEPITLVAYESFPSEGTSVNELLSDFADRTGIEVEILIAGDTGTMLSKAELTAGNPEGGCDVGH